MHKTVSTSILQIYRILQFSNDINCNNYWSKFNENTTYGSFVFFVDLNCFVRFARDEATTRLVEYRGKYARLWVYGARLHCGLQPLEVVTRLPVPEMHCTIVTCNQQNNNIILARKLATSIPLQLCNNREANEWEQTVWYRGQCWITLNKQTFTEQQCTCKDTCELWPACQYVNVVYRVAQKNGATLSHCKYSENSITELRGNWWTYAMLYAEHSH